MIVSEYSFFLTNPQAAWMQTADRDVEEANDHACTRNRMLGFRAMPDKQTSERGVAPNVGTEVILVDGGGPSASLGTVSTCFAPIDGKTVPIDQGIQINVDATFFNDIYPLRDTKLHLHVRCASAVENDDDFKEQAIVGYRVSVLPSDGRLENKRISRLFAKLFQ
jgi:hypothetical protein